MVDATRITNRPVRHSAWAGFLTAGALGIVWYYALLGQPATRDLAFVGFGAAGTVAILTGMRLHRPSCRVPWVLWSIAFAGYSAANITYAYQQIVLGAVAPFPSITEAFLLLIYYPPIVLGLLHAIHHRHPGRDLKGLVNAGILTVAVASIGGLLLGPWFEELGQPTSAVVVAAAFPVSSLLVLAVVARLAVATGLRDPAVRLLVFAAIVQATGMAAYATTTLVGRYTTGSPIDVWLLAPTVLWGAAALHPSMRQLTERQPDPQRWRAGWLLALLGVAVLALPAVVLIQLALGAQIPLFVAAAGLLGIPLLVLIRMAMLITQGRDMERQLVQSQRLQALGQLAGGIAHDFNNLLTTVGGYCELARSELGSDHEARSYVDDALSATRQATELAGQLLTFSRGRVATEEAADVNDVVESMQAMLARIIGEDIHLETNTDPQAGAVPLSAAEVSQVLLNLVVNARDAMPEGGRLVIATSRAAGLRTDHHVVHSHEESGDEPPVEGSHWVRLEVSDSGSGMDPIVIPRIVEPFYTTKEPKQGTGLGLATVYGVVTSSGGHLGVSTAPGVGSTFEVLLPIVRRGPVAAKTVPTEAGPRGDATVLVVDDKASVRTFVATTLRRHGYRARMAAGGNEALSDVEQHGLPDVLVTDLVMPGMRGEELAEKLQALHPHVRVLFMSGFSERADLGFGEQPVVFLQKPFAIGALLRSVDEVLMSGFPTRDRS